MFRKGRGRSLSEERFAEDYLRKESREYDKLLARGKEAEAAFKRPLSTQKSFATSRPLSSSETEQLLREEQKKRRNMRLEQVRAKERINSATRREEFQSTRRQVAERVAAAWTGADRRDEQEDQYARPRGARKEQHPTHRKSSIEAERIRRSNRARDGSEEEFSTEESHPSTTEEKDDGGSEGKVEALRALYRELEQYERNWRELRTSLKYYEAELLGLETERAYPRSMHSRPYSRVEPREDPVYDSRRPRAVPREDSYEKPGMQRGRSSGTDSSEPRAKSEQARPRGVSSPKSSFNGANGISDRQSFKSRVSSTKQQPQHQQHGYTDVKVEPDLELRENDVIFIDDNGIRLGQDPESERMASTTWFALAEEELSVQSSASLASNGSPKAYDKHTKQGIRLDVASNSAIPRQVPSRFSDEGEGVAPARNSELIQRLQAGGKARVSREEMLARTRRAVARLPESAEARKDGIKREEEDRRRLLVQAMDLERREKLLHRSKNTFARGRSASLT